MQNFGAARTIDCVVQGTVSKAAGGSDLMDINDADRYMTSSRMPSDAWTPSTR